MSQADEVRPSPKPASQSPDRKRILLTIMLPLAIAGVVWMGLELDYASWDFRNNLWGPSSLLTQGRSPYKVWLLYENTEAVWFYPVIGLFFPLGWLDLPLAANLWFMASLLIILALAWWYRREEEPSPILFGTTLAALVLFPPVLSHLVLGQFSLLATLLLLLATLLFARDRLWLAGLPAALVLSKPQLVVLVLPGLWLASLRRGKEKALVFPLAVFLGLVLFSLPLWIGHPAWIPGFIEGLRRIRHFWFQPTLYVNAHIWWGPGSWILPGLLSLALFALNLRLWWRYPAEEVLPWSLALTTIASPYIWTWDFVLLLPLILRALFRQRSRPARLIWILGLGGCFGLMTWIHTLMGTRHNLYFWVPWMVFVLVWGSQAAEARWSSAGRPSLLRQRDGSGE